MNASKGPQAIFTVLALVQRSAKGVKMDIDDLVVAAQHSEVFDQKFTCHGGIPVDNLPPRTAANQLRASTLGGNLVLLTFETPVDGENPRARSKREPGLDSC